MHPNSLNFFMNGNNWKMETVTGFTQTNWNFFTSPSKYIRALVNTYELLYTQERSLEGYYGNLDGGIKFQVHPRNVPPEIERYGLSVPAGMQASIDVHKTTVSPINAYSHIQWNLNYSKFVFDLFCRHIN